MKTDTKVKFSFGYDNNVSEQQKSKIESRFYQFYINSGMNSFLSERTLLSIKLQDGIKYLDAPSLSGESILISGLNLFLSHRFTERLIPEIQSEIRGRSSIHSESDVLPSEEAYLRGSAGVSLNAIAWSDVICRAFYHYRFTNFEDFDPFNRHGYLTGLRTDVKLLPSSTISLQYSREKERYDKWKLVSTDEDDSRMDTLDDISVFMQFYTYFLFDITYAHQNNKSDAEGYSYHTNRLALLLAKSLPWDIMLQLHAHIRSKKYCSVSANSAAPQIDLEDDERGVLAAELSKDIGENYALEAQYDLRSSKKEEDFYTKGIFSFSLSFRF